MQDVSRHIFEYAQQLGRGVHARALVVYADAIDQDDELRRVLQGLDFPTVLVTRSKEARAWAVLPSRRQSSDRAECAKW